MLWLNPSILEQILTCSLEKLSALFLWAQLRWSGRFVPGAFCGIGPNFLEV